MSTLRERLAEPRPLLVPGVYDALTALLAEQAGFERCTCPAGPSPIPSSAAPTSA